MDKTLNLTRSGKAGRTPGTTEEIKRSSIKEGDIVDVKGSRLGRVLGILLMESPKSWENVCKKIKSEIIKKLQTYSRTDVSRCLPGGGVPSWEDICELILVQKCRCKYCHSEVLMLYGNRRDPLQWSLDRIDNDKSHHKENIVMSCLCCNLKRRNRDATEFYNSKNLIIEKSVD